MNEELSKDFTKEEIYRTIQQMQPTKALVPKFMLPLFFQKYWQTVGYFVNDAVIRALNTGKLPTSLNHTFITLTLKKRTPIDVAKFCPFSLCNVIYKLISKVIANRLKVILSSIIFDTQSAFVPRRQIKKKIFVAYELIHFLRRKRRGKKGYMSNKLDISQAYDRVE